MTPKKRALFGLALVIISFILPASNLIPLLPSLIRDILLLVSPFLFLGGTILMAIGLVRMGKQGELKRFAGPIGMIFLGSVLAVIGVLLTLMQIKGDIRGVYIVGFIPVPLIVLTPLGAIAGAFFFFGGIAGLMKEFLGK